MFSLSFTSPKSKTEAHSEFLTQVNRGLFTEDVVEFLFVFVERNCCSHYPRKPGD